MPEPNLVIPGYELLEEIGKGGMATVYRARQQSFNRNVALKILRQDLNADVNYCQRFLQESTIVANLHHSHIVQVYDVGEVNHHCFMSMEFLSGGDLSAHLQRGLSIKQALDIVRQIASALDYAHRKNVIHRDIKPDNIMFREDGAAVLTDFGIAKNTDDSQDLTQTGMVMGTPKYMSPEQIRGQGVKGPSDLYSLGVVLYQLLTNQAPYQGTDVMDTAFMHVNNPIPTLPPSLSRYQALINRMMAKQVAERYHSGQDIVLAIEALMSGQASEHTLLDTVNITELNTVEAPLDLQSPTETSKTKQRDTAASQAETLLRPSAQKKNRTPLWTAAALGVLGAPLLAFLVFTNSGETSDNQYRAEIDQLMTAAQQDIAQSRLRKPAGNNAYDKYQRVLQFQPEHPGALAGLKAIAESYLILASKALEAGNTNNAWQHVDAAKALDYDDQALAELEAKLVLAESAQQRSQQRSQQRIVSIQEELQIEGLLQSAAIDEREGRTKTPADNNAQEKYQRILAIDPNHVIAQQKLLKLSSLPKQLNTQ